MSALIFASIVVCTGTVFVPERKKERREKVFPEEKKKAFHPDAQMVNNPW